MCFFVLLGALLPRVTLALLWWLTTWLDVLQPWWVGLLGFLFLPYTTLAYVSIHHYAGHVAIDDIRHAVILLIAVLFDFGHWHGGHRYRSRG